MTAEFRSGVGLIAQRFGAFMRGPVAEEAATVTTAAVRDTGAAPLRAFGVDLLHHMPAAAGRSGLGDALAARMIHGMEPAVADTQPIGAIVLTSGQGIQRSSSEAGALARDWHIVSSAGPDRVAVAGMAHDDPTTIIRSSEHVADLLQSNPDIMVGRRFWHPIEDGRLGQWSVQRVEGGDTALLERAGSETRVNVGDLIAANRQGLPGRFVVDIES